MLRLLKLFARAERAAVAPTVALSLFGLIASGGLAFDYARLATLDTELQQAADQAALAAATQLDRTDDSQTHATTAITDSDDTNRLSANITRFANDDLGTSVDIDQIVFCSAFDDSNPDTTAACTATSEGKESVFVVVTTSARTANYAFTPIVAALRGTVTATAVAGIQSSICNVAPLLVCAPNKDFPSDTDVGKGLLMKPLDGISGNYGLLDFGNGTPAVTSALMGFGLNGCQATDDNQTEPGTKTTVTDAVNTRMDVYATNNSDVWSNKSGAKCNTSTGFGCPASNTSKDLVLQYVETFKNQTSVPTPTKICSSNPGAANPVVMFQEPSPQVAGFDRDNCFYNANHSCGTGLSGNIGDGNWNRAAYFAKYHGGDMSGALAFSGKTATTLTRYDVYQWELADAASRLAPTMARTTVATPPDKNGKRDYTITTQCTYSKPVFGATSYPTQKDRRLLPVVAADCTNLKGKGTAFEDYTILRVFDVFLTEPSQNRTRAGVKVTDEKEIFGEIVGPAETVGGGGGFQYYTRNKPYLVR